MGAWQVDPAELHRVYPQVVDAPVGAAAQTQRHASELYERLLAEKDRQIESLTEQLKAADEERRTTLRQLTALLTDQREKQQPMPDVIAMPPPSTPAETSPPIPAKEIGWFRRMMGGR
jgi:hypothetical protein